MAPAARNWPMPVLYAAAILLCIAIYWRTADFKLTGLDDKVLIACFAGNQYHPAEAFATNVIMQHKAQNFYRPLQSISFMWDAALSKSSPVAWYRTNIVIHCLTVCLILYLLILLGFDRRLSFFAAIAFAASPLFANAVAWIPGRGDLLIGLFGTLSFIGLEQFRRRGNPLFLILHGCALILAVFSKESAIILPGVFALYLVIRDRKDLLTLKNFTLGSTWCLITAAYLFFRHDAMSNLPSGTMFGLGPFIGNLRVLPESIAALFACNDIPVLPGFTLQRTAIGSAVIAGIVFVLAKQKKLAAPAVILGATWFVLLSIPGMMFRHEFGSHAYDYLNHRSYLPMIGVFMLLAEAVPRSWYRRGREKTFAAISAIMVGVLCILAWRQSGFFADQQSFYGEAIRTNPVSALAHYNRGTFLYDSGDQPGALKDFDAAISLYPDYAVAFVNRGNTRAALGDISGAIADVSRGVALNPNDAIAFCNLGLWKEAAHDTDAGLTDLNRSLSIDPALATAYNDRGIIFLQRQDYRRALADFNEAIRLHPVFPNAVSNRGITLLYMRDTAGAIEDYSRAIALDPSFANAYNNRGLVYLDRHDNDHAAADFQEAIRIDPRYGEALSNLGRVKLARGDKAGACATWRESIRLGSINAQRLFAYYCK